MKKLLALSLALLMVMSLAACGSSKSTTNTAATPAVKKTEDKKITINIKDWKDDGKSIEKIKSDGTYTGELKNGVPDGTGTFTSKNADGEKWTYTGSFKKGTFDGYGESIWEKSEYSEKGTYTNGLFTPTKAQLVAQLGVSGKVDYETDKAAEKFVEKNESLFPCSDDQSKKAMVSKCDTSIGHKEIVKSVDLYIGKIIYLPTLRVLQIWQEKQYGQDITEILALDENGQAYYFVYYGVLDQVFEGTAISAYGMLASMTSYKNNASGTTNAAVLDGCVVAVL